MVIVRFTASWCVPCQRVNTQHLLALSNEIVWYVCDLDENDYTPGYAGVRTIPAFLAIRNGVPLPVFQSSDTHKISDWIRTTFDL